MRKITKKVFAAVLALSLFAGFSTCVASFESEELKEYLQPRSEDYISDFSVIPTMWFNGKRVVYQIIIVLINNDTIIAKVDLNDNLDDDYELQIFHLQSYDEENPEIPETLFGFKTLDIRQEAIDNGWVRVC